MENIDILYMLRHGNFDDLVDEIFEVVKDRIGIVANRRSEILNIGDEVRLCDRIKPNVLAGATGQVTKIGTTTTWVRLYENYSKEFPAMCTIEVPNTAVLFV